MYQLAPMGPSSLLEFHLLGLGFWMFRVSSLLLMLKKAFWLHCNSFWQRCITVTSRLKDKLPPFELVCFHSACIQCQHFPFVNRIQVSLYLCVLIINLYIILFHSLIWINGIKVVCSLFVFCSACSQ